MNDRQIEKLIQSAEKTTLSSAFFGTRFFGVISLLATPLTLMYGVTIIGTLVLGLAWGFTYASWLAGNHFAKETKARRALLIWNEIYRLGTWGEHLSRPLQDLLDDITKVYERDPQGEVLPIPQAVRLALAWKQQEERLIIVEHHIQHLVNLRAALLEKQKSLNELGDDNAALPSTLNRLNADIEPLVGSIKTLRSSCARLEALIGSVDAAIRRRDLHREIGELTAQVPVVRTGVQPVIDSRDERLDIERQITREIETFLQLERETNAHLRNL